MREFCITCGNARDGTHQSYCRSCMRQRARYYLARAISRRVKHDPMPCALEPVEIDRDAALLWGKRNGAVSDEIADINAKRMEHGLPPYRIVAPQI